MTFRMCHVPKDAAKVTPVTLTPEITSCSARNFIYSQMRRSNFIVPRHGRRCRTNESGPTSQPATGAKNVVNWSLPMVLMRVQSVRPSVRSHRVFFNYQWVEAKENRRASCCSIKLSTTLRPPLFNLVSLTCEKVRSLQTFLICVEFSAVVCTNCERVNGREWSLAEHSVAECCFLCVMYLAVWWLIKIMFCALPVKPRV